MPSDTLSEAQLAALAAPVREIADEAGEAVMAVYRHGFTVETKADRTPVTDADHASEAVILPALTRLTPDIPVVSEEAASRGESPAIDGSTFWAVDPLDGTREFIDPNDEFSVNIGLIVAGIPVFGVLLGPAIDTCWWTASPGRVMRKDVSGETEVAARHLPSVGATVIASRRHGGSRRLAEFLETVTIAARIETGSALKFGRLAEGSADLYPRFGPTCEWDTAAGDAILRAAGGMVTTLDGAALTYGKRDFLNPDFIARGRL
jgi:3'(2'), 5'-bisphosphate nucleotidase